NPALDVIKSERITNGAVGATFTGTGGTITDATNPGGTNPHIPNPTSFTQLVNITDPRFVSVSDLDVTVNLNHPDLRELRIELVAPDGVTTVPLIRNALTQSGTATGQGVTGANLGTTASGIRLGTVFDQEVPRGVVGSGATAPFTGHFRPEVSLATFY